MRQVREKLGGSCTRHWFCMLFDLTRSSSFLPYVADKIWTKDIPAQGGTLAPWPCAAYSPVDRDAFTRARASVEVNK